MSAYNGSGTFVVSGVGLPYVTGTTISSTVANSLNTDLATGLSTAICKDGQTITTAIIPFALGLTVAGGDTLLAITSGSWTPTDASGAALTFGSSSGNYIKIGKMVLVWGLAAYPVTASAVQAIIGSLPFTASNTSTNGFPSINLSVAGASIGFVNKNTTTFSFASNGAAVNNSVISSTTVYFSGVYPATS